MESGLFPCYRLKINDFLSRYNQNLNIDIFNPLQKIPCYCKSRLGTLRLISWWRVTNIHKKGTKHKSPGCGQFSFFLHSWSYPTMLCMCFQWNRNIPWSSQNHHVSHHWDFRVTTCKFMLQPNINGHHQYYHHLHQYTIRSFIKCLA